uniref:Uncharacterized protein n=1 Tax=mine drainage metagenome TaxID=410659 RepID=E6QNM5_9ZZZZ
MGRRRCSMRLRRTTRAESPGMEDMRGPFIGQPEYPRMSMFLWGTAITTSYHGPLPAVDMVYKWRPVFPPYGHPHQTGNQRGRTYGHHDGKRK